MVRPHHCNLNGGMLTEIMILTVRLYTQYQMPIDSVQHNMKFTGSF